VQVIIILKDYVVIALALTLIITILKTIATKALATKALATKTTKTIKNNKNNSNNI